MNEQPIENEYNRTVSEPIRPGRRGRAPGRMLRVKVLRRCPASMDSAMIDESKIVKGANE